MDNVEVVREDSESARAMRPYNKEVLFFRKFLCFSSINMLASAGETGGAIGPPFIRLQNFSWT